LKKNLAPAGNGTLNYLHTWRNDTTLHGLKILRKNFKTSTIAYSLQKTKEEKYNKNNNKARK
jgi:hypothetical protein